MANVQHSALTGAELHEPKGADSASTGEVYVSDGSGSGAWGLAEGIGATKDVIGTDGYVKLPGGVILQWGRNFMVSDATESKSFNITFPNQCFGIWFTSESQNRITSLISFTTSGYLVDRDSGIDGTHYYRWFAVGN